MITNKSEIDLVCILINVPNEHCIKCIFFCFETVCSELQGLTITEDRHTAMVRLKYQEKIPVNVIL